MKSQNQNKMPRRRKEAKKIVVKKGIRKSPKKILTKKVWVIKIAKQWWEYDDYDYAKEKLKKILDAGCWFGKIEFKKKEVKDDTKQ